jgi:hypothetical protein
VYIPRHLQQSKLIQRFLQVGWAVLASMPEFAEPEIRAKA